MCPKGTPGHVRMRRQHLLITGENGYLGPLSTISGSTAKQG
jgi:hypothetical protein